MCEINYYCQLLQSHEVGKQVEIISASYRYNTPPLTTERVLFISTLHRFCFFTSFFVQLLSQPPSLPSSKFPLNLSNIMGRFHLVFDYGENVQYPNGTDFKYFPWLFAKIHVGYGGKIPFVYKTKVVKNVRCDEENDLKCCPDFNKETISFDFTDTLKLMDDDEEIILRLELWEERMIKKILPLSCECCNKLLGVLHFNLREVLCNPYQPIDDFFSFTENCTTQRQQRIRLQMNFLAARNGLFCISLLEGKVS